MIFFILFLFRGQAQDCDRPGRFVDPIFSNSDIERIDIPFVTFDSTDLWNDGKNVNACFNTSNYLDINPDGTFTMNMSIYAPKGSVDNCTSRPVIIFMHGGGYAHIAGNRFASNPVLLGEEAAKRGYVAAVIDYRKGWDIKDALSSLSIPPIIQLPLLEGCQSCPCDGPGCDKFSFMLITYQMAQDVLSAHKKLINEESTFGIDKTQIHYWGASTGAVGVMHAAYGGEMLESYTDDDGTKMKDLAGTLDHFGESISDVDLLKPASVHLLSGAIKELDFIQDNGVPLFMSHGTSDEAVKYCAGRILDMKYRNTSDWVTHLQLQGPGKIYRKFLCLDSDLTKAHLYTYNGLFHSFTGQLGGTNLANNCNQLQTLDDFLDPALKFTKDIVEGTALENEHHRVTNAAANNQNCNFVQQDDSTPCNALGCEIVSVINYENEMRDIKIFPNPARDYINVENDLISDPARIRIVNSSGAVLWEINNDLNSLTGINIDNLSPGIYYVQINSGSKLLTEKFVKL